jgi:predicted transcriptional regulator
MDGGKIKMTILHAVHLMKTHLVTVNATSPLSDAVDRMDLYQVDELPVLDEEGRVCGTIEEAAIARFVSHVLVDQGPDDPSVTISTITVTVRDVMLQDVPVLNESDNITRTLIDDLLLRHRRIAVVSEEGKPVGSLNRVDVIQALISGEIQY